MFPLTGKEIKQYKGSLFIKEYEIVEKGGLSRGQKLNNQAGSWEEWIKWSRHVLADHGLQQGIHVLMKAQWSVGKFMFGQDAECCRWALYYVIFTLSVKVIYLKLRLLADNFIKNNRSNAECIWLRKQRRQRCLHLFNPCSLKFSDFVSHLLS